MRLGTQPQLSTSACAPRSISREAPATIYVVEDDKDLRQVLTWILSCAGYESAACASAGQALELIVPYRPGCVLIDLHLPDMNGLELRKRLLAQGCRHPFIVVTGCRDVEMVVQSLKNGAVDYLQKPFDRQRLLECVRQAVEHDGSRRQIQRSIDVLTEREREILSVVADGSATKEIAHQFGISPRTVEVHRHNILKKTGAKSLTQLIRALGTGFDREN